MTSPEPVSACDYPDPTLSEQVEFVYGLYFGFSGSIIDRICGTAYLDLSRTVHGIAEFQSAVPKARELLVAALGDLQRRTDIACQSSFDVWHEQLCGSLQKAFYDKHYDNFHVGQAQKWINMSLKYVFAFGELRLPGFTRYYAFAHVPIDNVVLTCREFKGAAADVGLTEPWSRLTDYRKYMQFQLAVRKKFPDESPLAVEFWSWEGSRSLDATKWNRG